MEDFQQFSSDVVTIIPTDTYCKIPIAPPPVDGWYRVTAIVSIAAPADIQACLMVDGFVVLMPLNQEETDYIEMSHVCHVNPTENAIALRVFQRSGGSIAVRSKSTVVQLDH